MSISFLENGLVHYPNKVSSARHLFAAYPSTVRRITKFFDRFPDTLTIDDLRHYFSQLIGNVSWITIKLDRCGLQFFYKHTLHLNL
ncbi:phage integrase N-terminal SAM-like domain-containing protein [Vibrio parahaemolyticus]|nr:phage integrase N-terminal SAM-like domain-containing protein [Vibrio parahaemolyticus]EIY8172610.1 phage integrase N-terminal SAM-like domain-containing protein [Vibrio parahaemolyticus]EIY8250400.1 phage integrase N-terminal SAM-like domain-containing protein [Vibrio parahaemolyticus]EJB8572384.1 phage integrase N-terminal SAM-like domain-containing protein [Vibrio parahaemolyticus]EJE4174994.1 phage integrase N-terminal SAM-like domain-containing protein [Vibrio parahaemolyticus]